MGNFQQTFSVDPWVTVEIKSYGNLTVRGWNQPEMRILGEENAVIVRQDSDFFEVLFLAEGCIDLPCEAALQVEKVVGICSLEGVKGLLNVILISGALKVKNTGGLVVERLRGDCVVEGVDGGINIEWLRGRLAGRAVCGDVVVTRLEGEMGLDEVKGSVQVRSSGDVFLGAALKPGQTVDVRSGGMICMEFPGESDVDVELHSRCSQTDIRLDVTPTLLPEGGCTFRLGSGAARIVLKGSERIILEAAGVMPKPDMELHHVTGGLSPLPAISDIPGSQVEKVLEALNDMRRKLEASAAQAEQAVYGWAAAIPPVPPAPTFPFDMHESYTEDVRTYDENIHTVSVMQIAIVQNLFQQQKIRSDEVERLLEWLEAPAHTD